MVFIDPDKQRKEIALLSRKPGPRVSPQGLSRSDAIGRMEIPE